jgi:large subunit ribosomal protein L10
LKGAYINAEIYIGDDQLDALATIKSRRTYRKYWIASITSTKSYFCTSKQIPGEQAEQA